MSTLDKTTGGATSTRLPDIVLPPESGSFPADTPLGPGLAHRSPRAPDRGVGLAPRAVSPEPDEGTTEPKILLYSPPESEAAPGNDMASESSRERPTGAEPPDEGDSAAEASPTAEEPAPSPEAHPSEPASSPAPGLTTAEDRGEYTAVTVYYGTDRALLKPAAPDQPASVPWGSFSLASAGLTLILAGLALRFRPARLTRLLAGATLAATVLFGLAGIVAASRNALWAGRSADGEDIEYGGERGDLTLGTCEVAIPKRHEIGELESPSIFRLEFREDPAKHVSVLRTTRIDPDEFFGQCRRCIERSESKGAFVFVHGYNVSFNDAARRTAQIAYDLRFDGVPMFYSWPSKATMTGYTIDETNVQWTVPHLKAFLAQVSQRAGARQVHLIAHSMGNRALTSALRDLSFQPDASRPKFHEVVLTAPDIDAEVFKQDIAPAIVKTAQRVTLYASSNDVALAYSKTFHGYPRAGDTGGELVVIPGIDTIDVSAVDTSLLGHSYYGSNDSVLADLFEVLHDAAPPDQRKWLRAAQLGVLRYWIFQR
jgi:esterase/lipase superfamily enzyme